MTDCTSRPKQLQIEGVEAARKPAVEHFTLDGHAFDFDVERNTVWVLPPVKPWKPKPPTRWQVMADSLRRALL